jgi:hypothetical protein
MSMLCLALRVETLKISFMTAPPAEQGSNA